MYYYILGSSSRAPTSSIGILLEALRSECSEAKLPFHGGPQGRLRLGEVMWLGHLQRFALHQSRQATERLESPSRIGLRKIYVLH